MMQTIGCGNQGTAGGEGYKYRGGHSNLQEEFGGGLRGKDLHL